MDTSEQNEKLDPKTTDQPAAAQDFSKVKRASVNSRTAVPDPMGIAVPDPMGTAVPDPMRN